MTTITAKLLGAYKILFVSNKEIAANYYTTILGFKDEGHGCFERDGAWIILHENKTEGAIRPNHLVDGWSADLYVAVDGIDAIYEEFTANGANIVNELKRHETGMMEFTIKDTDGYWINFGEYIG
jgi:uncharacterized glyoxalase superfamily protein PhnB